MTPEERAVLDALHMRGYALTIADLALGAANGDDVTGGDLLYEATQDAVESLEKQGLVRRFQLPQTVVELVVSP